MFCRRALLMVLFVACCSYALHGQTAPAAVIKTESRLVVLDVSVTDSKGAAVFDLTEKDFRVSEDKQPQTILNFEPPSVHFMPPGSLTQPIVDSSADLKKIGKAPVTVLILDELNMNFEDESYARYELIKWLAAQPAVLPQPTALMAVTYVDFHVLRDYTQSRDELLQVLRKHAPIVPWRKDTAGKTGGMASEHLAASLGSLEQIAQATRSVPGRKNVIWVGDGFPSVGTADVGLSVSEKVTADLRRLSNIMLAARVSLYIIGPTLKAMQPVTIETQADADTAQPDVGLGPLRGDIQFAGLAPPTGGRAYTNRNDMDHEIGESIAAGGNFYTLAYSPTNHADDPQKYRKIRVEVLRPGLTIQTRDGYYPESPPAAVPVAPTKQELAFDLYGAAFSNMAYTDLGVRAERSGLNQFLLRINAGQLTWRDQPDGKHHAGVIVLAVCFSSRNRVLGRNAAVLGSDTPAPISNIAGATADIRMTVTIPPATYRIRFVVRDAVNGRVGTADFKP
jgi:VWFA-related protein